MKKYQWYSIEDSTGDKGGGDATMVMDVGTGVVFQHTVLRVGSGPRRADSVATSSVFIPWLKLAEVKKNKAKK